ncbi:hypothetical protein OROGR_004587 [Orobanche gracilis]
MKIRAPTLQIWRHDYSRSMVNQFTGNWIRSSSWNTIPDPLNGEPFIKVSEVDEKGIRPFAESLSLSATDNYAERLYLVMYQRKQLISFHCLRVSPKSYQQALGEVYVTQKFLENFCGDQSVTWQGHLRCLEIIWVGKAMGFGGRIARHGEVIGNSLNGTTYVGLRARTAGAPQNHWFGPVGDPRGAGIGAPEAIKLVWSCHREVIYDIGPLPQNWTIPSPT